MWCIIKMNFYRIIKPEDVLMEDHREGKWQMAEPWCTIDTNEQQYLAVTGILHTDMNEEVHM